MIIICHRYKYLKLIKIKATKLFPKPEKGMSIRVSKTSKSASLDSKIKARFSWTEIVFLIFRKPNVIGVYRVLEQIKLLVA